MDVDTDAIPPTSAAAASQLHPLSVVDNERRCVSYRQMLIDILQGPNRRCNYFILFIFYNLPI